ncbi:hypothetical protein DFQ30_003702 [Apophysomyces sp. BC1015]|nr:hypothetical protein DFQ30_003702 [Apophysomyces sp. BC1015]
MLFFRWYKQKPRRRLFRTSNLTIPLFPLLGHYVDNRKVLKVEPLNSIKLDVAPRPESFFQKRSVSPNPSYLPSAQAIEHDDILRMAVNTHNQSLFLHLVPNPELFHTDAVVNLDGVDEPLKHEDYRVYRGYVVDPLYSDERWIADQAGLLRDEFASEYEEGVLGWARVLIRHDIKHKLDYPIFEGAFRVRGDMYHIQSKTNYKLSKRSDDAELTEEDNVHMVVYRDSDTVEVSLAARDAPAARSCGFDNMIHGSPNLNQSPRLDTIHPRNFGILASSNGLDGLKPTLSKRAPPAGCPTTKKTADCTYAKYYQPVSNVRMQIIKNWNLVSAVYDRTFNIQLGLINITIKAETCPTTPAPDVAWNQACSNPYTITNRLSDFSRWRGQMPKDGAGLWHLMTNCATGVEIGLARLNGLCTTNAQALGNGEYASGTGVSSIIRDEWKVVAHEIGHNFGAIHDCTSQDCPCSGPGCKCCTLSATECDAGGAYIMNPSNNVSTNDFSPCSINTVCTAFPKIGTCLEEPNSRTIKTLQMCGNGILEDGEDCDVGDNDTQCCQAKSCKFKPGAVCEDANSLCCDKCQIRPANYTCRPATDTCDIEEKCTGTAASCPPDKHVDDGSKCGDNLQCASGKCTSRDVQCKARGSAMNVTAACSSGSGSCSLICNNPRGFGCYEFTGSFIDGTPCGIGGACKDGRCNLDNFGTNAKNWIENNLKIVIPVAVVVGLLLLCCVARCCCYGYYSTPGYRVLAVNTATAPPPPMYNAPYYPGPGQAPPPGWVDPSAYNGNYHTPPPPPPSYTPAPPYGTPPPVSAPGQSYEMNPAQSWQPRSDTPPQPAGGRRLQEGTV